MVGIRRALLVVPALLGAMLTASHADPPEPASNATYFNDASLPGADPFVLRDPVSGEYFAYSTEGADPGHHFAIYRSADLTTWQRIPGGALDANQQWGRDWFWAPEVYHNARTGKYFLFYSARMREGVAEHFTYADFEEPSKIGVAVADSPTGPFRNIADRPLDYFPYDPNYHDVNLIMDETQRKPPDTLEEGMTAPLGTYIPFIDPNVFFDDGRIYLYFSRNAYRNWVWDHELGKYIEESNIYAVELTSQWWDDPAGATMPEIHPSYRNTNRAPNDPPLVRKDGFTPILNYGSDPQPWENAHVNDYEESQGQKKNRRWAEGSTAIRTRTADGKPLYFLTYSANNYAHAYYGVGYAVAPSPLGPWTKSDANPVLHQDERKGMYSTGHGSVIASPDSRELYYVHHGRPKTGTDRRLYTERMHIDPDTSSLSIDQSTDDEPVPSGVAPYSMSVDSPLLDVSSGQARVNWTVASAPGTLMGLSNPLNRVTAELDPPNAAEIVTGADHAVLTGRPRLAALTMRYQRLSVKSGFFDVVNRGRDRVAKTVPVASCTRTLSGPQPALEVADGVLCLRNASVSGPVRVKPGAVLVVIDSTVDGPIDARGAAGVWLARSEVSDRIRIEDTKGLVRAEDLRVRGAMVLRGNTSSSPIVIAGNTIDGSLSCAANSPAPVNAGRANEVGGSIHDQCAGL
ncbi:glycoside hydrolase family 43 protein [Saccharopolyspora taberi]|uniref:Beta-xylosidase n=1 Tax=Saccharopolyspora taberi TaxID=60895 RepID=A0ABN3VBI7_9PSEU